MKSSKLRTASASNGASGFSLPELLVVIVILGVIGAVGIPSFFFLVRRARVQSVALEVAGWMENVRNAGADAVSDDLESGGCEMDFSLAASASAVGNTIATAACEEFVGQNILAEDTLLVPPGVQQDTVSLTIFEGPSTIIFTPRGLWTDVSGGPGSGFTLSIELDGGGPLRCVRLTPVLGSVEIGRTNSNSADDCENWQTL